MQRSAGATRYETAVAVYDLALAAGLDVSTLWLATGRDWPDALTSGPIVGRLGQTVLLVDGLDPAGSPAVLDRLRVEPGVVEELRVIGGEAARPRSATAGSR